MRYPVIVSLGFAVIAAPAIAGAQVERQPPDTTRTATVRAEARGEVASGVDNRGLTQAQVRQLQQSLRALGCDPGTPDGQIGRRTREAIACARARHGLESDNVNDLLRAMELSFASRDSVQRLEAATPTPTRSALLLTDPSQAPIPRSSDPTFQHDPGFVVVQRDTMPAGLLETSSVFVTVYPGGIPISRYQIEVQREMPRQAAPEQRAAPPPVPAEPSRAPRVVPDTVVRDTVATPVLRTEPPRLIPPDSARLLRPDTTRAGRPVPPTTPDTALRRMRDEMLLELPPGTPPRDTIQQADTVRRIPPDTSRVRPDTTRRPPP